jgi:hypothetical protein
MMRVKGTVYLVGKERLRKIAITLDPRIDMHKRNELESVQMKKYFKIEHKDKSEDI